MPWTTTGVPPPIVDVISGSVGILLAVVLDSPQLLRGALSLLFFACFVLCVLCQVVCRGRRWL